MRINWAVILLLGDACCGASASVSAAGLPRAEIPIREVDLSDGTRRYVVDLVVDGQPMVAGLDTGSTGLRILSRAFSGEAAKSRGRQVSYFYSSGTRFEG